MEQARGSRETERRRSATIWLLSARFLAWIRTGLALMGFGFVVARFGLFLEQIQAVRVAPPQQGYGLSLWFGTALIAAGVILNVFAGIHHLQTGPDVWTAARPRGRHHGLAVAVAFLLAAVGLGDDGLSGFDP